MTTILIEDLARPRSLKLDAVQAKLFVNELARVQKTAGGPPPPLLLAADCRITVRDGTKKRVYELYARAVLCDAKSRKTWQFYFGLLLLEWLAAVP